MVLPHAVAYNAPFTEDAMARIARALGKGSAFLAAVGLFDLAKDNGAPTSLREIGIKEEDLDKAAEIATSNPY